MGLDTCILELWVMPLFEIKREFDKHHSSLFVLHEYRYMAFNYRSLQTTRRDLVKRESIPWYLIQGMKGFWQVKLIFCCKLLWIFNTDINYIGNLALSKFLGRIQCDRLMAPDSGCTGHDAGAPHTWQTHQPGGSQPRTESGHHHVYRVTHQGTLSEILEEEPQ